MKAASHSIRNPFHDFGPNLLHLGGAAFLISFAAVWLAIWLCSSAALLSALDHLKQRHAVPAAVQKAVPSTGAQSASNP